GKASGPEVTSSRTSAPAGAIQRRVRRRTDPGSRSSPRSRSQVLTLPGACSPCEFTCDDANRLPRLQWSTQPSGTRELAVEMLDPDARGGTFTHRLVYQVSSLEVRGSGRSAGSAAVEGAFGGCPDSEGD